MLLSASMIVKDEEANLPECLSTLVGLVDEVVLYDTGSTDRTLAVARECAAENGLNLRIVGGFWDDDFSRARNASLESCSGTWILVVDADEGAACRDPAALSARLSSTPQGVDVFQVTVADLTTATGEAVCFQHDRIFRRKPCHWIGRLHERIRLRDGNREPGWDFLGELMVVSRGYSIDPASAEAKAQRNLRIAEAEVRDIASSPLPAQALLNFARSLAGCGRHTEALDAFQAALARDGLSPLERAYALEGCVRSALEAGRWQEAGRHLPSLWRAADTPELPLYLASLQAAQRKPSSSRPQAVPPEAGQ